MSKIQFESKSQPANFASLSLTTCKQLCQRYNLKANHNPLDGLRDKTAPVSNYVKDTI